MPLALEIGESETCNLPPRLGFLRVFTNRTWFSRWEFSSATISQPGSTAENPRKSRGNLTWSEILSHRAGILRKRESQPCTPQRPWELRAAKRGRKPIANKPSPPEFTGIETWEKGMRNPKSKSRLPSGGLLYSSVAICQGCAPLFFVFGKYYFLN